jgi:hypothetical protein
LAGPLGGKPPVSIPIRAPKSWQDQQASLHLGQLNFEFFGTSPGERQLQFCVLLSSHFCQNRKARDYPAATQREPELHEFATNHY